MSGWDERQPQPAHMQTGQSWPVPGQQSYPSYSAGNIGQAAQSGLHRTSPNTFLPPPPPLVRYPTATSMPPNQTIGTADAAPQPNSIRGLLSNISQPMYRSEPNTQPSFPTPQQMPHQSYQPTHHQPMAQQVRPSTPGVTNQMHSSGSGFSNVPRPAHQQQPQTVHMQSTQQQGQIRSGFAQGFNSTQQNQRLPTTHQINNNPNSTCTSQFQQNPQQMMNNSQTTQAPNPLLQKQHQQRQQLINLHKTLQQQQRHIQQQQNQTQQQHQARQQQPHQTRQQPSFQTERQKLIYQIMQDIQQKASTPTQQPMAAHVAQQSQQRFPAPSQQPMAAQMQQQNQQQRFPIAQQTMPAHLQQQQHPHQRFPIPQQQTAPVHMQQQPQQQQQHYRPPNTSNHPNMGTTSAIPQQHAYSNPSVSPAPPISPNYPQNPQTHRLPFNQQTQATQRGSGPANQVPQGPLPPPPPYQPRPSMLPQHATNVMQMPGQHPNVHRYPQPAHVHNPSVQTRPTHTAVSCGSTFVQYPNNTNVNQATNQPKPQTTNPGLPTSTSNLDDEMTRKVLTSFALAQLRKEKQQLQQQQQQQQQHVFQNLPAQANPSSFPKQHQHTPPDNTSQIMTAFKLTPPDPEPNDIAVLGRWYAQPSNQSTNVPTAVQNTGKTSQTSVSISSSFPQSTPTASVAGVGPWETSRIPGLVPSNEATGTVASLDGPRPSFMGMPDGSQSGHQPIDTLINPGALTNGIQRLISPVDSVTLFPHPSTNVGHTDTVTSPSVTSTVMHDNTSVPSTPTGSEMSFQYYIKPSIETENCVEYKVKDLLEYLHTFSATYREKVELMRRAEAFRNMPPAVIDLDLPNDNEESTHPVVNTDCPTEISGINSGEDINKGISAIKNVNVNGGSQTSVSYPAIEVGAPVNGESKTETGIVGVNSDTFNVAKPKDVSGAKDVVSDISVEAGGAINTPQDIKPDKSKDKSISPTFSNPHDDMMYPEGEFLQETSRRVNEQWMQLERQFENFDPSLPVDPSALEQELGHEHALSPIELTLKELQNNSSKIPMHSVPVTNSEQLGLDKPSSPKTEEADFPTDNVTEIKPLHPQSQVTPTENRTSSPSMSEEQLKSPNSSVSEEQAKFIKALEIASKYHSLPEQDAEPEIQKPEPVVELDIAETNYIGVAHTFPGSIHPYTHDMYGYGAFEAQEDNTDGMDSRGSSGKKRKRDSDGDSQRGSKKSRGTAKRGKRGRGRGKPGSSGVSRKLNDSSETVSANGKFQDIEGSVAMDTESAEATSSNTAVRGTRGTRRTGRGRGRGRGYRGQKNQGLAISVNKTTIQKTVRGRGTRGKRGRGRGRGGSTTRDSKETSPMDTDKPDLSDVSDAEEIIKTTINSSPGNSNSAKDNINSPGTSKSIPDNLLSPEVHKEVGQPLTKQKTVTPIKLKSKSPNMKECVKAAVKDINVKLKNKLNFDNKNGDERLSASVQDNQDKEVTEDNENVLEITVIRRSSTDSKDSSKEPIATSSDLPERTSPVNIPVETIIISDLYQVTWVRFHGKVTTRLITPSGNLFLVKELFRRCLRIQASDKRNQMMRIQGIMKSVLKIQEKALDPVLVPYVIKNLKDRKVIKTVPDSLTTITESDANNLFHYVYADKFCDEGCITVCFKEASASTLVVTESGNSEETGTQPPVELPQASTSAGRNIFDLIESTSPTVQKTQKTTKSGKSNTSKRTKVLRIGDFMKDRDDNGYDTDSTLPYVDGTPQQTLAEIATEAEHQKETEKLDVTPVEDITAKKVITVTDTTQVTEKDINSHKTADIDIVVLDSDADSDEEVERPKHGDIDRENEISEKSVNSNNQSTTNNTNVNKPHRSGSFKDCENFVEITIHDSDEEESVPQPDQVTEKVCYNLCININDDGHVTILNVEEQDETKLDGGENNVTKNGEGKDEPVHECEKKSVLKLNNTEGKDATILKSEESNENKIDENEENKLTVNGNVNDFSVLDDNGKKLSEPVPETEDKSAPILDDKENSLPVLDGNEKSVPVIESKEKSVPILKSKEKSVPVIESKEKSVPVIESKEKSVPIIESKEKSVPVIESKEKSAPIIESKEKSVPILKSKEKSVPVSEKNVPTLENKEKSIPILESKENNVTRMIEDKDVAVNDAKEKESDNLEKKVTELDSSEKGVTPIDCEEKESEQSPKPVSEHVLPFKSPSDNGDSNMDERNLHLVRSLEKIKKFIRGAKRKLPELVSNDSDNVIVIDGDDRKIRDGHDKHETAQALKSTPIPDSQNSSKVSKISPSSETLSEKSSDGEIDIEAQGRSGSCRENPFVSSCDVKDVDIMAFEKRIRQCIDKANKTDDAEELADVCAEVLEFTKPLDDLSRKYLSEVNNIAIAQGTIMEVERRQLMKELSMDTAPICIDLDVIESPSPQVIEVDPAEMDNGT